MTKPCIEPTVKQAIRTEVSFTEFERDQLRFITIKSKNLKGRGDICVFVPKGHDLESLPLVLLLHGVYGSCWSWAFNGGAHLTAQKMIDENKIAPMILAMPSDGLLGDGSAYLPHHGFDFEKWIIDDVVNGVIENIPQASKNSKLFISGLSMGGFAALNIGAKYHNKIAAISAHSAITDLAQLESFIDEPINEFKQQGGIGEQVITTILENKEKLPPLRFDCGIKDNLLLANRELHQQLIEQKITHQYQEFDGEHNWDYWQQQLSLSLLFFNDLLPS